MAASLRRLYTTVVWTPPGKETRLMVCHQRSGNGGVLFIENGENGESEIAGRS